MVDDLNQQQRAKWEEIDTYKNYQRQLDQDFHIYEHELREREREDDALYDQQLALQREKENFQTDLYLDSLEGELRKVEEERGQLKDFMKYMINIDHHFGILFLPDLLQNKQAGTKQIGRLADALDRHDERDVFREKRRESQQEWMQRSSLANSGLATLQSPQQPLMDQLRGDKRGTLGLDKDAIATQKSTKGPKGEKTGKSFLEDGGKSVKTEGGKSGKTEKKKTGKGN